MPNQLKPKAERKLVYQKVKYVGPKAEVTVCFPIPFVSKCEQEGPPVTFNRNVGVDLLPHQAQQLVTASPEVFKMVDPDGDGN
jgi:hypothetical protein